MIVKVNGDIISNDLKEVYDWFGFESTCPADIVDAIQTKPEGEKLEIKINSGGGLVDDGKQIYSILRGRDDVHIEVESIAGSAASVIAMAGPSSISPAGMIMIHDVSCTAAGNKNDMKKTAEILKAYDESIAAAYSEKTGMEADVVLKLMDRESWLPADRAVELGFIDAISESGSVKTNGNLMVTDDMIAEFKTAKDKETKKREAKQNLLNGLDDYGI